MHLRTFNMLNSNNKIEIKSKQVELKPYTARAFKSYELMSDSELLEGAGGTLVVDTETYPNYHLIAFRDIKTDKVVKFEIKNWEGFNEKKLSWILHSYRTIGFNSNKYDLAIIWYAFKYQNTEAIKRLSDEIIFQNTYTSELEKVHDFKIYPTNHIDLIEVCPLKGSLKLYGARLHTQRIQDIPFSPHEPLTEEQIDIVSDYCINGDLPATGLLFNNLEEQLKLRYELNQQYNQNLLSKSDAQIAEAVIGSELKRITGWWPKKPKIESGKLYNYKPPSFIFFQTEPLQKILAAISNAQHEVMENGRTVVPKEIRNLNITIGKSVYRIGNGGLHSSEQNTAFKSNDEYQIYDRDVASYYPAIVLNCKLYPQHLGEDFLKVYQTLVNRRLTAKEAKNIAVSECLKICINGTFGKTGSPYSILYAPEMMIQITVTGQLALLMLIEKMELSNIQIISANTDGIAVYCHKDKREEMLSIIKMWEQITGFVTEETKYKAIYSRDVNAYIAIKENEEVKGKNLYYDPWRAKTARDLYWRFQKNPQAQICIEAIENLIIKDIPLEKTIQECKDITKFVSIKNVKGGAHKDGNYLGKVVRWAYFKNELGTINYITNNHKVPDTEGARPLMDLPETFPNDLNYSWYIAKCNEMLMQIGYLKRQEQIRFF